MVSLAVFLADAGDEGKSRNISSPTRRNRIFPANTCTPWAIPSRPRVHIDGGVWHLDVGSSHPGAVFGPKGSAVRRLKWYASWVQNVARQFGPYLSWAQDI